MSVKKTYSKADRRQALRLHRKGWGYARIAEVIRCFPSTVKKWVEAAGVPKHPGPKHDASMRAQAVDWYKTSSQDSIEFVAKRFRIHPRTLSRWLREDGVKIRSVKGKIDREAVLRDISSGMKRKDIAVKHGCSESWVYRIQSGK